MSREKWMPKIEPAKGSEWTDWVQPIRKGYAMGCCDCGLVHTLQFKLVPYGDGKHKIRFRVKRDEASTKRLRKREGIRVRTVPK